jgi:hypothetical protein
MARYDDDDDGGHIDMRPLFRIATWGVCSVVAVGAVVFAGRTEVGAERAGVALAALRDAPNDLIAHPANLLATSAPGTDAETRRLADIVRKLSADRDRLASRVAALEQNLNDLTGSVTRDRSAGSNGAGPSGPPAPRQEDKADKADTAPLAAIAAPATAPSDTASQNGDDARTASPSAPAVTVPMPRPSRMATIQSYVNSTATPGAGAAAGADTRVAAAPPTANPLPEASPNGFAIDLGTATNVNTLRAHWGSVKTAHAALLDGLRPLVSVRTSARPGFTEFHLVAGPIADADVATRLCAALTSVRVPCRPATFDGQRLDLR